MSFRFRRELGLLVTLIALMTLMSFLSEHFLTQNNLLEASRHYTEIGILACGMTLIIMTGGIDLSVGSLLALSAIVMGYLWKPLGPAGAIAAGVACGVIGGMLNGVLVMRGFPALVVTLGTMALFRGVAMVISKARPISDFPDWFAWVGQGYVFGPVPSQLPVWLLIVAIFWVLVARTPVGRYATAIGDNERAAIFAALPVRAVKFWIYTITGLLAGLCGLIYTSHFSTARADAGIGLELEVITAVVLGGTAITGGRGTVIGTFLGVLLLAVLKNGLDLAGIPSVWQTIAAGSILIVTAVANQRMLERGARRSAKRA